MTGLTRGVATLTGAAAAGALVWGATQVAGPTVGDYWGRIGLVAAAGLVLALSQLLGGWTKWGWPRVSLGVLLVGFVPTLIAAGWVILYTQPSANWFQRHVESWSNTIGIGGLVHDLGHAAIVLAFGLGLVFGFIFDTTGPRTEAVVPERTAAAPPLPAGPARTNDTAATRVDGREDTAATRVDRPAEMVPARERGPEDGPEP
jgi:hypothetical protein